jgi:glutathione S-transferase
MCANALITLCANWLSSSFFLFLSISSSRFAMTSSKIIDRKIFVCTFRPVPHVYSICPFGIKIESFLRINKIPYEPVFGSKMSSKGMMPYIRLDDPDCGDEIPDSNVILARLQEELKQQEQVGYSESHLTPAQRATAHMLIRMLEEHTSPVGFYYRYGLNMAQFSEALDLADRFAPGMAERWGKFQPDNTKAKTKYRGLSRHSDEELWDFSNDDLQAISDHLGDEPYYFGDRPSLADCAVFGHVSQLLWIPIDFPQKKYLHERCPNIVKFMNRFRAEFWPDWEDLCGTMI